MVFTLMLKVLKPWKTHYRRIIRETFVRDGYNPEGEWYYMVSTYPLELYAEIWNAPPNFTLWSNTRYRSKQQLDAYFLEKGWYLL